MKARLYLRDAFGRDFHRVAPQISEPIMILLRLQAIGLLRSRPRRLLERRREISVIIILSRKIMGGK